MSEVAAMSDRAVSTVVSYVLTLGIITLLLTTLVGVFAPVVTSQQDDATRSTLEVIGNDIAGDLESADRLAGVVGDGEVELRTRLPDRIGGSTYEVEIEPEGNSYKILLQSDDLETPVTVSVVTDADVETDPDTLEGGILVITYDGDQERLVVKNA